MPTNKILVVGGAGYIGSHMVDYLNQSGYVPVVLDNLSTGHRDAVIDAELIIGDMADAVLLERLFATEQFSAVMHFASYIEVGESVINPAKYYQNNVAATITLLNAMQKAGISNFIFSSTAAVYGEPQTKLITEDHPIQPINPYGRGKWMIEQILKDYTHAYGLRTGVLRYFNAAGADPEGRLSERHEPESHLIPLVLQAATGRRKSIAIYGNDYDTPDGTCIRDYVHVTDLCAAHLLALHALQAGQQTLTYNLGTGQGYSVQQVIDTARTVTKKDIQVIQSARRAGDPAILVADATKAKSELGWNPKYSNLNTIIQHAYQTQQINQTAIPATD